MKRTVDDSVDDRTRSAARDGWMEPSAADPDESDDFYRGGTATSEADVSRSSRTRRIGWTPAWIGDAPGWVPGLVTVYGLIFAIVVALTIGTSQATWAWGWLESLFLACLLFIATVVVFQAGWAVARRRLGRGSGHD